MTPDQILELRKREGLSQTAFAAILGVTQDVVSHWETGRNKPRKSMIMLLHMLEQGKLKKGKP